MVIIENKHEWEVEVHWFNILNDGTWQFVHKEIMHPGQTKNCYISEHYYFKVIKKQ